MARPVVRDAAEHLLGLGLSVIPTAPGEKRPAVTWTEYQERRPTVDELAVWFGRNGHGLGIVTGQVSGLVVLDADSEAGRDELEKHLPDSLLTWVGKTPKGYHYYFRHPGGRVPNGVRVLPDVDLRGDGGQVVAPPTEGRAWLPGLSPDEVPLAELPDGLKAILIGRDEPAPQEQPTPQVAKQTDTSGYIQAALEAEVEAVRSAHEGERNHTLNRAAFALGTLIGAGALEQGIAETELTTAARAVGLNGKETQATIRSGIESGKKEPRDLSTLSPIGKYIGAYVSAPESTDVSSGVSRPVSNDVSTGESTDNTSLSDQIAEWLAQDPRIFSTQDLDNDLSLRTRKEKTNRAVCLHRLEKSGLIERIHGKRGWYRPVDSNEQALDWLNIEDSSGLNIAWPLGLEAFFEVMPGSIIVVAGTTNSGKTAFCLETVRLNMDRFEVFYFASSAEVNARTLRRRIEKFGQPLDSWNFKAVARPQGTFHHVVRPEALNVIDYLEVHGDFWEAGGMLAAIHEVLTEGVVVVALQKNPDAKWARGGALTMDKATAYLSLDRGDLDRREPNTLRIMKAKYPKGEYDCNGRVVKFKLVGGAKFIEAYQ
ncbi:MAG: bifunctional DNA primase/polymerase [Proteobacteria bacterium]|nr:bifunctional DNA primase/polymerase [Pseudomonadota bacterium]